MTTERRDLTNDDVMALALEGCNAAEIAAFAGVSESTAKAMLAHARTTYARSPETNQPRSLAA